MDFEAIYKELKSWQAGIAALLGFGGLMVAALWNFHLNRRRDAAIRKEEGSFVASALYSEIVLLRKEVALVAKVLAAWSLRQRRPTLREADEYKPREPVVYPAVVGKIGLLQNDLVFPIVRFYAELELVKHNLPLMVDDESRGYTHSILSLLSPAKNAVVDTRPVLRRLETILGLPPVDEPDLGDTDWVIEMEEEFWQDAAEEERKTKSKGALEDAATKNQS